MPQGKQVVLGVTGGIAAYKAVELCRLFTKAGASVRVVMTKAAKNFVNPLTFATVTSNKVYDDLFAANEQYQVQHVGLATKADLFVVAPATANFLGKMSAGIADDLLTTTALAVSCPVLVAPAMNDRMYHNPIVQQNIERLRTFGVHFVLPEKGELACGVSGTGRLAAVETIFRVAKELLRGELPLLERHVLVTAGPTREALDPIRFFSNRSTGKMGYAIARQAAAMGARVTLVSGPTSLSCPPGVERIQVTTALDMYEAVMENLPSADIVIKAAAVADYRPEEISPEKIKKTPGPLTVKLVKNPDILLEIGQKKGERFLVGFAAETANVESYARDKMARKNLDMIVANDVTAEGAGFGTDTNLVTFYFSDGTSRRLPMMSKGDVAKELLAEIAKRMQM